MNMHVLLDLLLSCNSGDALLATPLICRDQLVSVAILWRISRISASDEPPSE